MKRNSGIKTILSLGLATVIFIAAPVQVMASGGDNAMSGIVQSVTAKSISINVRNADVRDVLSAVAVNMGYSIVYNGSVGAITIKLDDVLPETAFDYILKGMGMTYLQEGSTLIIGTREMLNQDFARSLALTSFVLQYITPDVLTSKIQQLKLPVTVLSLDANENSLWVQGFPADIAKVRELISILDIEENYDGSGVDVPDKNRKTLSYVRLNYLTGYEFNRFLKTLGIDNGLSISDDDDRLWIYANSDERKTISDLRSKVDHSNSSIDVEGADTFGTILVKNISKANAVAAVKAVCPGLTLISVDNASKVFFVKGSREDIERAQELVINLDGLNTKEISTTVFTYSFDHITAAEGSRRLENVTFGDNVTWYATTHDEFSKVLFVYCNADYRPQIEALLKTIDEAEAVTFSIPVYSAKELAAAEAMRQFLVAMLGDRVSQSIDIMSYANVNVVYLHNTDAETVQLVDQMIERLGGVPNAEEKDEKQDLSLAAWEKEYLKNHSQTQLDQLSAEDKLLLFNAWVQQQNKRSASGARFASPLGPIPENDVIVTPVVPPVVDPPKVDPPVVDPPKVDPPVVDPPKVDPPAGEGTVVTDGETLTASADTLLQSFFNANSSAEGTFLPTHATNAALMLAAAKDRLAQESSLAGVTVSIKLDENSKKEVVNYFAPTTESGGRCAVSFLLQAGDYQRTSLVDLLLPLVPKA